MDFTVKFAKNQCEQMLRKVIKEYEDYCDVNRAQCEEAQDLLKAREELFRVLNLEPCAHNAALFGSKRYENRMFSGVSHAVTPYEYKLLMENENE